MEYGKVSYLRLKEKDFKFDGGMAQPWLPGTPAKDPKLHWGFPYWGRKEWLGNFYPKGTKDAQFLDYYVQYFNAIELNATHYQLPDENLVSKWTEKATGKDFLFCPKVWNEISHDGSLADKGNLLDQFMERVKSFGLQLGPLLFQVSDKFNDTRKTELETFLAKLKLPTFVELRHPNWYEPTNLSSFLNNIHRLKMGMVITDTPGYRDRINLRLATPSAFIRFAGAGNHPLDDFRLDQWKQQIKIWLEQGGENIYFFINLYEPGNAFEFSGKVKAALEPLFH